MKNNDIVVIILGSASNALGQVRCAHDAGYKCINLVPKTPNRFSAKSRYCRGYVTPDPYKNGKECLDFLKKIISSLPTKPYLFFSDDEWMMLVGDHEQEIKEIAHIIQTPWDELVKLYDKKLLYRIAAENDIPHPKTKEIETLKDIKNALAELQFPCIVKPQLTVNQNDIASKNVKALHRTQKFNTFEDAVSWADNLLANTIDFPVVIQEFIPGDATNLYTLTSYSDVEGNLVAGSIGYKLRQFPPAAGRITAGVLHYDDALHNVGKEFLKKVKFHGIANTEFKYDARDGQYKLMEINARFGAWNYSTLYSGINLMQIAINDYNGVKYEGEPFKTDKDEHIWYNLLQDYGCSVILNKKEGFTDSVLTTKQWRKSLGKNHFEAIFDWKDPMPFIAYLFYTLKDYLKGKTAE